MAITTEKILTISAEDWFRMNNKEPYKYEARGVHSNGIMDSVLEKFAKEVPSESEVVVDYRLSSATCGTSGGMTEKTYACGTALIHKK